MESGDGDVNANGWFTARGHVIIVGVVSIGQSWDGMYIRCCCNFVQIEKLFIAGLGWQRV